MHTQKTLVGVALLAMALLVPACGTGFFGDYHKQALLKTQDVPEEVMEAFWHAHPDASVDRVVGDYYQGGSVYSIHYHTAAAASEIAEYDLNPFPGRPPAGIEQQFATSHPDMVIETTVLISDRANHVEHWFFKYHPEGSVKDAVIVASGELYVESSLRPYREMDANWRNDNAAGFVDAFKRADPDAVVERVDVLATSPAQGTRVRPMIYRIQFRAAREAATQTIDYKFEFSHWIGEYGKPLQSNFLSLHPGASVDMVDRLTPIAGGPEISFTLRPTVPGSPTQPQSSRTGFGAPRAAQPVKACLSLSNLDRELR